MKILVLDGSGKNSLAIIRSLGKTANYTIVVCSYQSSSLCFFSRYVDEKVVIPFHPGRNYQEYSKSLIKHIKEVSYDLVMPVGYWSFKACSENHDIIKNHTRLMVPDLQAFEISESKIKTAALASRLGIPTPKTTVLKSRSEIDQVEVSFPAVIKYPFEFGINVVEYARNREELVLKFNKICDKYNLNDTFPIIQELIKGAGYGFFAIYKNGEMKSYFMHKRIREYPVSGGASVCAVGIEENLVKEFGKRILDDLKWNGVAMVEFKKSEADGEYKLLEINPKFWGSLQLSMECGINFPKLLINLAFEKEIKQKEYQSMRFQWLINGELFHLIENPKSFFAIVRDLFRSKNDIDLMDPLPNLYQLLNIPVHYFKKFTS